MSIENQSSLPKSAGSVDVSGKLEQVQCINFQNLKHWQSERYWLAVEEHRLHLSKELGSACIDWASAERDFHENGLKAKAEEWRHEYCGSICPFRTSCLLAFQFKWTKEESTLAETG